jgi:hypothetical protein
MTAESLWPVVLHLRWSNAGRAAAKRTTFAVSNEFVFAVMVPVWTAALAFAGRCVPDGTVVDGRLPIEVYVRLNRPGSIAGRFRSSRNLCA